MDFEVGEAAHMAERFAHAIPRNGTADREYIVGEIPDVSADPFPVKRLGKRFTDFRHN
jgi:hypothetical protein